MIRACENCGQWHGDFVPCDPADRRDHDIRRVLTLAHSRRWSVEETHRRIAAILGRGDNA